MRRLFGQPPSAASGIPKTSESPVLRRKALFFGEFNLAALQGEAGARLSGNPVSYRPISRYPSVFRDFSFLLDRKIPYRSLIDFISSHRVPNLKQIDLIDLYQSEQLAPGKISLAIRLYFENSERTLTDEEVQAARDQIVEGLSTEFGVIPR